jgi:hypothetical protein
MIYSAVRHQRADVVKHLLSNDKFIQDADNTTMGPQKLLEQAHEIKNNELITLVKEYIRSGSSMPRWPQTDTKGRICRRRKGSERGENMVALLEVGK